MKKIPFLLIACLPLCTINAVNEEDTKEAITLTDRVDAYTILADVQLSTNEVVTPLVIRVAAPSETIIGINGPCMPNITNWKVENGYLTITYTRNDEIMEMSAPGIYYIEVATNPMRHYAIRLTIY